MRFLAFACFLALYLAAVPAAAQSGSNKEAFKKTEKGMGRLLEAMGKEVKKAVGTSPNDDKSKQKKKAEKVRQ